MNSFPPAPDTARRILLVLVALAALCAAAPAAEGSEGIMVERIEVTGLRYASARVILSESLLHEGESYTEEELRAAVNRITRLPFVLKASMSLRKGTERDTFVLVISVEETLRFFFAFELPVRANSDNDNDLVGRQVIHRASPLLQRDEYDTEDDGLILAGFRLFTGRTGVLFAALNTDNEGFEVGYSRYDLFGRSAFFNVGVSHGFTEDLWRATAELGVPVSGNHSIRLLGQGRWETWNHSSIDDTEPESRELRFAARWQFDTRNDTLFATHGDLVFAGLEYFDEDFSGTGLVWWVGDPGPSRYFSEHHTSLLAGVVSATRYRPLSNRTSWSWGGRAAVGRSHEHVSNKYLEATQDGIVPSLSASWNTFEGEANVGLLRTLWRPPGSRRLNDLRWRSSASLYGGHYRGLGDLADASIGRLSVSTALELRARWGVLRLSLIYRNWWGDEIGARPAIPVGALR